jgi:hypothetical protein
MLLDVVSLYNKVTDLTDRKQAVKISIGGVQVGFASTPAILLFYISWNVLYKTVFSLLAQSELSRRYNDFNE